MLKIERQQRIKELILFKQNMKISELSQELGVSEMTIHRDIKPLIEEGIILKTFGGIKLVPKNKDRDLEDGQCVLCGRNVQDRFSFRLVLRGNRMETACCPHCGILRYEQVEQDTLQLICHDFLAETTINAKTACMCGKLCFK